jgi:hypothetical protein
MRADVLAVVLFVTLPFGGQRGAIDRVTTSTQSVAVGGPVSITVTGTNPCGAVRLNYGDGTEAITHPLTQVPATIQYTYQRPGNFEIRAEGMGNCDGVASTKVRVIPQQSRTPDNPPSDTRFRAMDENNDGIVSLSEWRGTAREFRKHDSNGDGVLTRREFPEPRARVDEASGDLIVVSPTVRWTNTGIHVREGALVRLEADGIVQLSNNPADNGNPGGLQSGRRAPGAPLPGRVAGALIARVGNSAPIFVGTDPSFRAPANGQLYLGVNDDTLDDNRGQFKVRISIGEGRR